MSSSHLIIVAHNTATDDIELPLGNTTLYGVGDEEKILERCRKRYDNDWILALYRPISAPVSGTKSKAKE
ncbi:MAG: hypothetical protein CL535_16645 [Ahrensia sp.]|nr:hypothetical protein [Ahrensia sp.]MBV48205.1 hypothetical protein [Roseobacter sp.]MBV48306.1 hypothetical protein [Roseobacter sp.]|tara:strand:+ start:162230 stop:162439 length:210 start_codon:yes stop_codon:yes gene_type:complete